MYLHVDVLSVAYADAVGQGWPTSQRARATFLTVLLQRTTSQSHMSTHKFTSCSGATPTPSVFPLD